MRIPLKLLTAAVTGVMAAAGFFAWGYFAHRNQVFPYKLVRVGLGGVTHLPETTKLPPVSPSANVDVLRAIPYVGAHFDPSGSPGGVIRRHADRATEGYNFYPVRDGAHLLDMQGRVVHRWKIPGADVFHATLLPAGELVAIATEGGALTVRETGGKLLKVAADSRVLWSQPGRWHHDLSVAANGDIYALINVVERIPDVNARMNLASDYVAVLSASGELRDRISVLRAMQTSRYRFLLPSVADVVFPCEFSSGEACELDLLHANHVEVFDGSVQGSPLYRQGNLLVSMRTINTIAIIDGATREVVWAWGPGNLTQQHHPTLLPNGNILVFDNGLKRSEVVEIDPRTERVVWRYAPPEGFWSERQGSVQRLGNGNTLITESDRGRVFEITPDGTTVWEFKNPDIDDRSMRRTIWRMLRFRPSELSFLQPPS